MQNSIHNQNKAVAYKGLLVLLVVCLVVAAALLVLFSKVEAYSAFLGGMAFILPNYYFARFAFRFSGEVSAGLALKWFMIGEVVKYLLTGLFVAVCVKFVSPLNMLAFMLTFIFVLILNLIFLHKNMAN